MSIEDATVENFSRDYLPILRWYIHQPASKGSNRVAARTVLKHGIAGKKQVKAIIDACELYLKPDELPPEERERAEAVLGEAKALLERMRTSEDRIPNPDSVGDSLDFTRLQIT